MTGRQVADALGLNMKTASNRLRYLVVCGQAKTENRGGSHNHNIWYTALGAEVPEDRRGSNLIQRDPGEFVRQFRREGASSEIPSLSWADLLR